MSGRRSKSTGKQLPRLKEFREANGISAADAASRCGISRQTVYAIEDGTFVPNTTTAIRLARMLGTTVEELFPFEEEASAELVSAELLAPDPGSTKHPLVRLCRVGERMLAVPVQADSGFLPFVDGVVEHRMGSKVTVRTAQEQSRGESTVLIAGCDPALSFLEEIAQGSGIRFLVAPASSRKALEWLKAGRVHVAGSHLFDRASRDYNLAIVQRMFPPDGTGVVTFADWQEGLVMRLGESRQIRSIADLGSGDWRIVNREKGSGSRSLLDEALSAASIDPAKIPGYDRVAGGHLAAASAVANGAADCCVATSSAARSFGLAFVPLTSERFDLVFSRAFSASKPGQVLLDILNRAALRRKLQQIAGYDTSRTGDILR